MVALDVRLMRPFLIVGQVGADPLRQEQHYGLVHHVKPVTAAHQLPVGVARERVIRVRSEIGLVEIWHREAPLDL